MAREPALMRNHCEAFPSGLDALFSALNSLNRSEFRWRCPGVAFELAREMGAAHTSLFRQRIDLER